MKNNTEESTTVIKLNSDQAVQRLNELRKEADQVKAALKGMASDHPEYKQNKARLKEISKETKDLKDQLKDRVELIIDGKAAAVNINELTAASRKLTSEVKKAADGSVEFVEKSKRLREINEHIDTMNGKIRGTGGEISKVGSLLGTLGIAFGIGEVLGFFKNSFKAFTEAERGEIRLQAALKGRHEIYERLKIDAAELQDKLGIEDDVIMGYQTFLANQGRTENQIRKTINAAVQLSHVTGEDLDSAVKKLDATFEGEVGKLGKVDAGFKNLTKAQLASGAAVDLVLEKYGDFAGKTSNSTSTAIEHLSADFNDLEESIGSAGGKLSRFIEEVDFAVKGLSRLMKSDFQIQVDFNTDVTKQRQEAYLKSFEEFRAKMKAEGSKKTDAQMAVSFTGINNDLIRQKYKEMNSISDEAQKSRLLNEIIQLGAEKKIVFDTLTEEQTAREHANEVTKEEDDKAAKLHATEAKKRADLLLDLKVKYSELNAEAVKDEANKELEILRSKYEKEAAEMTKERIAKPKNRQLNTAEIEINQQIDNILLKMQDNFERDKTLIMLKHEKLRSDEQLKQDLDNLNDWNEKEKASLKLQLAEKSITQEIFEKQSAEQQKKFFALKIVNLKDYFKDTKKLEEEIAGLQGKANAGTATKEENRELEGKKKQLDEYLEYNKSIERQITQAQNDFADVRLQQNKAALDRQEKELNALLSRATKSQKNHMLDLMSEFQLLVATGISRSGDSMQELLRKMDQLWKDIGKSSDQGFEAWQTQLKGWLDKFGQMIAEFTNSISSVWGNLNKMLDSKDQARLNKMQAAYNKEEKHQGDLLKRKLISQEKYDEKMAQLKEEQDKAGRKAAHDAAVRAQRVAIFNAVINGAQAVLQALASFPPPYSYILAAVSAVAAGVEIAAIKSEPIPELGKGTRFEGIGRHPVSKQKVVDSTGASYYVEDDETLLSSATRQKNKFFVDALLDASQNNNGELRGPAKAIIPTSSGPQGGRGIGSLLSPTLAAEGSRGIANKENPKTATAYGIGALLTGPSHASPSGGMPIINPETGQTQAMVEGGELVLSKEWVQKNPKLASQSLEASQKNNGEMKDAEMKAPAAKTLELQNQLDGLDKRVEKIQEKKAASGKEQQEQNAEVQNLKDQQIKIKAALEELRQAALRLTSPIFSDEPAVKKIENSNYTVLETGGLLADQYNRSVSQNTNNTDNSSTDYAISGSTIMNLVNSGLLNYIYSDNYREKVMKEKKNTKEELPISAAAIPEKKQKNPGFDSSSFRFIQPDKTDAANPISAEAIPEKKQKNPGIDSSSSKSVPPKVPSWFTSAPKTINTDLVASASRYDRPTITSQTVPAAAPGYEPKNSSNTDEVMQQMLGLMKMQHDVIADLRDELRKGIKSDVVLTELERKQKLLGQIRKDSTLRG
jgi:hypothetical protein